MKTKAETFKLHTRKNITVGCECFWEGEIFAHNDAFGMCDELRLAQLLRIQYVGDVQHIVGGDFSFVAKLRNSPHELAS